MANTPLYLSIGFIITTLLTGWFFYKATRKSILALTIIAGWLLVQGIVSATGFYTNTNSIPPRLIAMIAPPLIFILILFSTKKGRTFIDELDTFWLHWLHVVRVPVEITLLLLFTYQLVPKLMTFEGINFDILSGITAPVIVYFGYQKKQISKTGLLIWNIICLGLLINIVFHGILSVPTPFQRFGFEQPNIGLTYFPYTFLPGFIVPMVLFAHLASIRNLCFKNE